MKLIRENEMYQDNRKLHELVDPNGRWGLTTKEGDIPSGWRLTWYSIDKKSYAERHYKKDFEGLETVAEVILQKDLPAQLGIRVSDSGYIFLGHVDSDNDTTTGEILDRVDTALNQVAKYIVKHPILALSRIFNDDHRTTTIDVKNKDISRILKKYLEAVN